MKCDDEYKIKFSFGCVCGRPIPILATEQPTSTGPTEHPLCLFVVGLRMSVNNLSILLSTQYTILISQCCTC